LLWTFNLVEAGVLQLLSYSRFVTAFHSPLSNSSWRIEKGLSLSVVATGCGGS